MWKTSFALLPLLASSLAAQFSGPTLGLIYDAPNQALRRIAGIPGSATLSDPILTGISAAAIAPDHSFAIVTIDSVYMLFVPGAEPVALPPGLPLAARIVFSPAGHAAAFYKHGSTALSLVTGLPAQPALQAVTAPGAVKRCAVADSGTLLLSVARDPLGESIVEIPLQGQANHLLDVTEAGAMVFSADGAQAWIADKAENRIWAFPSASQIASAVDGISAPVALAANAQHLWIANAASGSVTAFDLMQNTAVQSALCSCKLTTLSPLAGSAVFRLTDLTTGPVWILDASGPSLQTLFVPGVAQ